MVKLFPTRLFYALGGLRSALGRQSIFDRSAKKLLDEASAFESEIKSIQDIFLGEPMPQSDILLRTMQPITRIVLGGLHEILGTADVTAALAAAGIENRLPANGDYELQAGLRSEELCRLQIGLEKLYGYTAGQGVILRCGRAGFKRLLQEFGAGIGLTDREYRFMPSRRRLTAGLRAVGSFFADGTGGSVSVHEAPDAWVWESNACPWCWQRACKGCSCFFMVGLLGEYFSWASGGKVYPLAETECMAAGAQACVIRIDKWALD